MFQKYCERCDKCIEHDIAASSENSMSIESGSIGGVGWGGGWVVNVDFYGFMGVGIFFFSGINIQSLKLII